MTLGKTIKTARAIKNMSRQRLADLVYTDEKTIRKYEEDKIKKPDQRMVQEIYSILGIPTFRSPEWLEYFHGEEEFMQEAQQDDYAVEENPKKMVVNGQCAYCGQYAVVEIDEDEGEKEADELATWNCHCEAAKAARHKKEQEEQERRDRERRIDNAVLDIQNLIGDAGFAEVAAIMQKAVPLLVDGGFSKLTIAVDGENTVSMSKRQKKIIIERKKTRRDQAESD